MPLLPPYLMTGIILRRPKYSPPEGQASPELEEHPFNPTVPLMMQPAYPWFVPQLAGWLGTPQPLEAETGDIASKEDVLGGWHAVMGHVFATLVSVARRGDIGAGCDHAAAHVLPPAAFHEYQMCKALYLGALTGVRALLPRAWHSGWCRLLSSAVVAGIVAGVAGPTCALVGAVGFSVGCRDELLLLPKRLAVPATALPPSAVTVGLLRAAATASAVQHRDYVKKDTGRRCYVSLQCECCPQLIYEPSVFLCVCFLLIWATRVLCLLCFQ